MHTIVILSDMLTPGNQAVRNIRELFPDSNILILSKKAMESDSVDIQSIIEKISPQIQSEQLKN